MEQIKNEQLTVEISSLGAELQSIKDAQGNEYLWDGDEQYWNRHSPILFPIVCGLWKDTYRIDGKEYQLGRHGFARDTEFLLISKGEDRITYALTDSDDGGMTMAQIVGFSIVDSHQAVGTITSVDDSTENILFEVLTADNRTILIPAVPEFIKDIDEEKRTITMDLPGGLLDL